MKNLKNGLFLIFGIAIAIACIIGWTPAKAAGPENNLLATSADVVVKTKYERDTMVVFETRNNVPSTLNGKVLVFYAQKGTAYNNVLIGRYDARSGEITIGLTELKKMGLTPKTAAAAIRPVTIQAIPPKKKAG